jgi:hypothetical protein
MHSNSLAAYAHEHTKLSRRADEILGFLTRHGPATDRQIKDCLHYPDMNNVRPRITELILGGHCHETGQTTDPATGKTVRIVGVSKIHQQMTFL